MLWKPVRALARERSGNIGISAALAMPLVITSMALAIDYGYLTVQKREMQTAVDLAAIAAAANVSVRDGELRIARDDLEVDTRHRAAHRSLSF